MAHYIPIFLNNITICDLEFYICDKIIIQNESSKFDDYKM